MFALGGWSAPGTVQTLNSLMTSKKGERELIFNYFQGIISPGEADESNYSVATMVIQSDELVFKNACATGLKKNSGLCGETIARDLIPCINDETIGLFVFADGLTINFDRFKDALRKTDWKTACNTLDR